MNRTIFISLSLILFFSIGFKAQNNAEEKIDSVRIEEKLIQKNEESINKDSISNLNTKLTTDPVTSYISLKLDSIDNIVVYKKDTIYISKTDSLFEFDGSIANLDSISKFWSRDLYDSVKVGLINSIEKFFKPNSKYIEDNNTILSNDTLNRKESNLVIDEAKDQPEVTFIDGYAKYLWFFIILITGILLSHFLKKHRNLKKKLTLLESEVITLKDERLAFLSNIQDLENRETPSKDQRPRKTEAARNTEKNIEKVRNKVKNNMAQENTLDSKELGRLTANQENRWVTVAHSAVGKNHSKVSPPIPCQDNNYFEILNDNWHLAIVCDGAGSAKMSHFGSKLISNKAIPFNLRNALSNLKWYKNGELPTKKEWKNIGVTLFKETLDNLMFWVAEQNKQNNTNFSVNDYASTAMLALYNSKGVLVANIGDGRGGYLNASGALKSLFTPFGGDESNGTIFITSPIWKEPDTYIQTDVINEKLLAVFLLSDGMEKITFECSNLTDDVFTDANIPFKKFFFPVLSKIKSLDSEGEEKLKDEWKSLLESGNDAIKNEGDDKTLLVSFLK